MALNVATACGRGLYVLRYQVASLDVTTAGDAVVSRIGIALQLNLATAGNGSPDAAGGQVLQVHVATASDGALQRTALHEVALDVTASGDGNLQIGGREVGEVNVATARNGQQHTVGLDARLQLHIATTVDGGTLYVG